MESTCQDLLDEYRELDSLCTTLSEADWELPSSFFGWTPWDEIAHLCYFDETALQAVADPDAFVAGARALQARSARGDQLSAIAREHFNGLSGRDLLSQWRNRYESLVKALARLDAKARLPWYGPAMSARSFATARLMETWAHGQDIWDVVGRSRPMSLRLKHIAHLGVTTFAWTFVNRGLSVPGTAPYVELQAGEGIAWKWGEPSGTDAVIGMASDFCLVVTQRRHVADTSLRVHGEAARQWMRIAQCFAGPPADGPAPNVRGVGR